LEQLQGMPQQTPAENINIKASAKEMLFVKNKINYYLVKWH
jgi:hypothetical protein